MRLTGTLEDGSRWELTESIRIKCADDDSSGDSSSSLQRGNAR